MYPALAAYTLDNIDLVIDNCSCSRTTELSINRNCLGNRYRRLSSNWSCPDYIFWRPSINWMCSDNWFRRLPMNWNNVTKWRLAPPNKWICPDKLFRRWSINWNCEAKLRLVYVVFTLNRSFYSTTSVQPVSVLILHPIIDNRYKFCVYHHAIMLPSVLLPWQAAAVCWYAFEAAQERSRVLFVVKSMPPRRARRPEKMYFV